MEELDRDHALRQVQEILKDVLNLDRLPRPEERLGRRLPDSEVAQLTTVDDIVARMLLAPPVGGG
jgi:hypothetical protein